MATATIYPVTGQSNYDLCLQSIGSLDGFISFLYSNGIGNSKNPPNYPITYDTNDVKSSSVSGIAYATQAPISPYIGLLDNDGTPLLDNDGQQLLDN